MDVTVDPFVVSECNPHLDGNCYDKLPREGYTHWHTWGGSPDPAWGRAKRPGKFAWTSSAGDHRTIKHEQGHNLGLQHSPAGDDPWGWATLMGGFSGRREFCAPNVSHMIPVAEAEGEGEHFIVSCYSPVYAGETQIVRMGQYAASVWDGKLVISSRDPISARNDSKARLHAELREGESAEVNGARYTFVESSRGAIRCHVGDAEAGEWPTAPEAQEKPANGFYSIEDASHQAVVLHSRDDELFGHWVTWTHSENQRWYLLSGPYDNLKIYTTTLDGLAHEGTGQIDGSGRFDYWLNDGERGKLDLILEVRDHGGPMSGLWGFGNLTGLSLVTQGDGSTYGVWMSSRERRLPLGPVHEHMWRVVSGDADGEMTIQQPHGGHRNVLVASELRELGSATFAPPMFEWVGEDSGSVETIKLLGGTE